MTPRERAERIYFENDEMCGFLRQDWFVEKVEAAITTAIDEALAGIQEWAGDNERGEYGVGSGWSYDDAMHDAQDEIRRRRDALKERG